MNFDFKKCDVKKMITEIARLHLGAFLWSRPGHYVISDSLTNVNNSGIIPVIVGLRSTVYMDPYTLLPLK
jgi:hypothetical protein